MLSTDDEWLCAAKELQDHHKAAHERALEPDAYAQVGSATLCPLTLQANLHEVGRLALPGAAFGPAETLTLCPKPKIQSGLLAPYPV
jgi:hypothetical protein